MPSLTTPLPSLPQPSLKSVGFIPKMCLPFLFLSRYTLRGCPQATHELGCPPHGLTQQGGGRTSQRRQVHSGCSSLPPATLLCLPLTAPAPGAGSPGSLLAFLSCLPPLLFSPSILLLSLPLLGFVSSLSPPDSTLFLVFRCDDHRKSELPVTSSARPT